MLSVYVVCWIFLQTFQTYFCIETNSVDPDQTAPRGAVGSGSTLFAKMTFKYGIYANIFAAKIWVAFVFANATHIFFSEKHLLIRYCTY